MQINKKKKKNPWRFLRILNQSSQVTDSDMWCDLMVHMAGGWFYKLLCCYVIGWLKKKGDKMYKCSLWQGFIFVCACV